MAAPPPGALFCEPVQAWFERRFGAPTEPQRLGWPAIARGRDALISAPTGSGKTLAAFLVVIDRLVRRAMAGRLEDRLEALYVSPLRALSHDIHQNLETPLAEIRQEAWRLGWEMPEIRAVVRTGDTPASQRAAMLRRPPHLLVTTPESLFLLITAERSRKILESTRTLIVDEIHALARDKRGSHLALSLARLDQLCTERPVRVGLSATQRPIELIARYLVGPQQRDESGRPDCEIVDLGHQRDLELAIDVPRNEDLGAVSTHEQWDDVLDGLSEHVKENRTTLVFTNTRRLAERLAHRLGEKIGAEQVAAHHGSLSRERRLRVEARLRDGSLRALVATASLELGIDIGSVDLVVQIGSPRGITTFLQRVGRSGHALGLVPRGRLVPTSRDELAECAALVRAIRAGRLDAISLPRTPLDILAQQIVAACASEEWDEDALFALVTRAAGYETLSRADYDAVLEMLARGIETPKGRRATYLHRDRLQRKLRGRRGARIAALTSGGAIPEIGDYRVVLDPDETFIGSVNEDWAIESMAGDVFLLGTHSWRIRRVESGVVRVVDAQGAPPTIPFWLGEAPARSLELSQEVSRLRSDLVDALRGGSDAAQDLLETECGLSAHGARQLAHYVGIQLRSMGRVPTCEEIVAERFFDQAGGMQLVVHSPWGGRINRGFGLALRKRFCASFDQELQAAATDDAIVLSLGSPQTFPLDALPRFLSSKTITDVLTQAMLGSPLFTARWRWTANRSLAVLRSRSGKRVPFPLQRMQADDLLAAIFPDLAACQENVTYPIDIPDHPLAKQVMDDCLHEATDADGLVSLIEDIEAKRVHFHVLDTVEPSPFAHEILNAKPFAFLDDAPLEERRTRAVSLRHVLPEEATELARLEPAAIERVRAEAAPVVRDADELYELLVDLIVLDPADAAVPPALAEELLAKRRAARIAVPCGTERLFAVERIGEVCALHPEAPVPEVTLPPHLKPVKVERDGALDAAARGHLAVTGPITAAALAQRLAVEEEELEAPLTRLEGRGIALRGRFDPSLACEQWCDRSLLARIHRYTLARLRREIEPVSARDYLDFLLRWQHLHPETHALGESGLLAVVEQLSAFETASGAWEPQLLTTRVDGYKPELLDALCLGGAVAWGRLTGGSLEPGASPSRATPIALFPRAELDLLLHCAAAERGESWPAPRGTARDILSLLTQRGALFSREIETARIGLPAQVEEGLKTLIARGEISCDGFAPLRRLLAGRPRASRRRAPRGSNRPPRGVSAAEGRWSRLVALGEAPDRETRAEATAQRLLRRYGVVFRDVLAREWVPDGWREVHRALRRFEARGLVRGGRFVSSFLGEQFALPEAIPLLREARRRERDETEIRVSAADPLNLAGILTPGPRVPAGHTRWLVFRGGLPVSVIERGRRSELSPATFDAAPGLSRTGA